MHTIIEWFSQLYNVEGLVKTIGGYGGLTAYGVLGAIIFQRRVCWWDSFCRGIRCFLSRDWPACRAMYCWGTIT